MSSRTSRRVAVLIFQQYPRTSKDRPLGLTLLVGSPSTYVLITAFGRVRVHTICWKLCRNVTKLSRYKLASSADTVSRPKPNLPVTIWVCKLAKYCIVATKAYVTYNHTERV